jgi:hypothetical protein
VAGRFICSDGPDVAIAMTGAAAVAYPLYK